MSVSPKPQRPSPLPLLAENIPGVFRSIPAWVGWKLVCRRRWTKEPIDIKSGILAETDNPTTWCEFDEAIANYRRAGCDGIGLCRTDDLVFIDLDGVLDPAGNVISYPWAESVLKLVRSRSYLERSITGGGLHSICRGKLPPGRRQLDDKTREHTGVAFYDAHRYFTFSGHVLPDSGEIVDLTTDLAVLHSQLFAVPNSRRKGCIGQTASLTDSELLSKARRAANGAVFTRLWDGETVGYASQSEADLALCCILAFWTGRDPARIDQLFRQSGLMRPDKWDRGNGDYRDRTIKLACEKTTEVWEPRRMGSRPVMAVENDQHKPRSADGSTPDAQQPVSQETATEEYFAEHKARIAKGFTTENEGNKGVYRTDEEGKAIWICNDLRVIAYARTEQKEEWGKLLAFKDPENCWHQWVLPLSMLAKDTAEFRGKLLSLGLKMSYAKNAGEFLRQYLLGTEPETYALTVDRIGWTKDTFVLPAENIGPAKGAKREMILFQPPREMSHYLRTKGTLAEWRKAVSRCCSRNSRLLFSVSCAAAAPLLYFVGEQSGGFHFVGETTIGKTTLLMVAGSFYGGGGQNGFVQSWLTTANALENTAEWHNNILLPLDELKLIDPEQASKVAYSLSNGQSKGRMGRDTRAHRRVEWQLLFLSTGELGLAS